MVRRTSTRTVERWIIPVIHASVLTPGAPSYSDRHGGASAAPVAVYRYIRLCYLGSEAGVGQWTDLTDVGIIGALDSGVEVASKLADIR